MHYTLVFLGTYDHTKQKAGDLKSEAEKTGSHYYNEAEKKGSQYKGEAEKKASQYSKDAETKTKSAKAYGADYVADKADKASASAAKASSSVKSDL